MPSERYNRRNASQAMSRGSDDELQTGSLLFLVMFDQIGNFLKEFWVPVAQLIAIGGTAAGVYKKYGKPVVGKVNEYNAIVTAVQAMTADMKLIKGILQTNGGASIADAVARMEQSLSLQRSTVRMHANLLSYATFEADKEGDWTHISRQITIWTGFSREDLMEARWVSHIRSDQRKEVQLYWGHCIIDQRMFEAEFTIVTPDEREVRVCCQAFPSFCTRNILIGWNGTVERQL